LCFHFGVPKTAHSTGTAITTDSGAAM